MVYCPEIFESGIVTSILGLFHLRFWQHSEIVGRSRYNQDPQGLPRQIVEYRKSTNTVSGTL